MKNKIIIIDDSPETLHLFRLILDQDGYTNVQGFTDPQIALNYIFDHLKPDLIITDYQMHGMNGVDLLEKIEAVFGNIKAVIVTSSPGRIKLKQREYPIVEKGAGIVDRLLKCIDELTA
ncbi:MAG: response regulator [Chitinivibrionales bacterium]|nr:response regulator [Chitinivibrionales bacterium]